MLWARPLGLRYGGPLAGLGWAQHAASKPDQNVMLWLEDRGLWECVYAGEPDTVQDSFPPDVPTHSEYLSLLTYAVLHSEIARDIPLSFLRDSTLKMYFRRLQLCRAEVLQWFTNDPFL